MALVITIESDLPLDGSAYVIRGNDPQNLRILVQNTDPTPVTIQQLFLTEVGNDGVVSLSVGNFKYISSSVNTTNNVIAASSTNTYLAQIIPQINSITIYPADYYSTFINCQVQIFGSGNTVNGTPREFYVYRSPTVGYEIQNPISVWDRSTNTRPPMFAGFDAQLSLNEKLEDGTVIPVPMEQVWWFDNYSTIGYVGANSEMLNVQENPYDPIYQFAKYQAFVPKFTVSGGSFGVYQPDPFSPNDGEVTIEAKIGSISNPTVATTSIWVVPKLPVSLAISPLNTNFYYTTNVPVNDRRVYLKAFMTYSDGSVEDVTNLAAWSAPGVSWLAQGSSGEYIITAPSLLNKNAPQTVNVSAYLTPVISPMGFNNRFTAYARMVFYTSV